MNIFECINRPAANETLRALPPVLRARDFYLYLEGGSRIADLWQLGGKAILGHKPSRAVGELKNAAERGLFGALPHPAENRFYKALAKLFAEKEWVDFSFRIYADKSALLKRSEIAETDCSVWRPFSNENLESLVYAPVLPWALSPVVLIINKSLEALFPPGELVPPVALVSATRAIYDLLAAGENGGRPKFTKIEKAVAAGNNWHHDSIYLFPATGAKENWPIKWKRFLEQGFLLPPSFDDPIILPGVLSPGEESKLAALLAE